MRKVPWSSKDMHSLGALAAVIWWGITLNLGVITLNFDFVI